MMGNTPDYFAVCWGAQRCGLYYTPVGVGLTASEAGYIVEDCGARILVVSAEIGETARAVCDRSSHLEFRFSHGGVISTFETIEDAISNSAPIDIENETEGQRMHYTSGTTGRPKGIYRPKSGEPFGENTAQAEAIANAYGIHEDSILIAPGPLYHAGPLGYSMATHRLGGTVVLMKKFDPEEFLDAVERYQVTHAWCVPTMFVRLLRLPSARRLF